MAASSFLTTITAETGGVPAPRITGRGAHQLRTHSNTGYPT